MEKEQNRMGSRQVRAIPCELKTAKQTREDGEELRIEGYFAVFNSNYNLWAGASESVAPGAFSGTLGDDIRALINHDTSLVLGRNKAGTLTLEEDSHGLWGSILINPNDQDAMNLYSRVARGDVNQCSFGFDILDEETEFREDGSIHWTIKSVKLYEVSVCTFPAYEETSVTARKKDLAEINKRKHEAWKSQTLGKLKGE
jgi:HK97 family phage prohead protease